jgi:beta-glucanase (GH16 family)
LDDYNIAATVGPYKADKHIFPATATDGAIHIRFTASQGSPTVSAIGIVTGGGGVDPTPPNPDDGWKVVTSDAFDGSSIDTSKWGVYSGKGNEGVGQRTPNNVKVHDGELELQGTEAFYGAGVANKLNFTHGRVVVRAKTDYGNGYGPALLMWPKSEKWPQDGEIDISEIPKGERAKSYFTVHWGANNSQDSAATSGDFTGWHTWAMEWTPDYIKGWVDGTLVKTITKPEAIPVNPMHLCLQQDVGADGHWIPGTDANTPPVVSLHVDSVQVFQKDDMS